MASLHAFEIDSCQSSTAVVNSALDVVRRETDQAQMTSSCTKCTNAVPVARIEHGFLRENAAKDEARSAAATPLDFFGEVRPVSCIVQ